MPTGERSCRNAFWGTPSADRFIAGNNTLNDARIEHAYLTDSSEAGDLFVDRPQLLFVPLVAKFAFAHWPSPALTRPSSLNSHTADVL